MAATRPRSIRLEDPDGHPRNSLDGFYAVWSRSGRTLMVDMCANAASHELPQVSLGLEQVALLRDFLADATLAADRAERLRLEDADASKRGLEAEWSRSGTRLVVAVTSPSSQVPTREVALHRDRVRRLHACLTRDARLPRPAI